MNGGMLFLLQIEKWLAESTIIVYYDRKTLLVVQYVAQFTGIKSQVSSIQILQELVFQ